MAENMVENIGQVQLNTTYCKNKDVNSYEKYNQMMQFVTDEAPLQDKLKSCTDWDIMYQMAPSRKNVIEWIDFDANKSALEIGGECGAITGLLCEKVKNVTTIETSYGKAVINATRHKACSNLEIIVGDLDTIHLDKKFDYIVLVESFTYAPMYVGGANPYLELTKKLSNLLTEDGKLIIAVDNKYGLKYFAGCKEGHINQYYGGLEGFQANNENGIKTFGKKQLEQFLNDAGCKEIHFYYPYPSHIVASSIYSDQYLPKVGELSNNTQNFDYERIVTFDETKVFDEIIRDDMFEMFSNSYLIIANK